MSRARLHPRNVNRLVRNIIERCVCCDGYGECEENGTSPYEVRWRDCGRCDGTGSRRHGFQAEKRADPRLWSHDQIDDIVAERVASELLRIAMLIEETKGVTLWSVLRDYGKRRENDKSPR